MGIEWSDTLLPFLQNSNEDLAYAEFFCQLAPLMCKLRGSSPRLQWCDIGAGPGSKTRSLLSALQSSGQDVALTIVEPDPIWMKYLSTLDIRDLATPIEICSSDLESWSESNRNKARQFSLFTAFHVLYCADLVRPFASLIERHPESLFLFSGEAKDSELARLRAALSSEIGLEVAKCALGELVEHSTARDDLDVALIRLQKSLTISNRCIGSLDSPGWFIPFVLGKTVAEFMQLTSDVREAIFGWIGRHFRFEHLTQVLRIPDDVLCISPRETQ